MSWKTRAQYRKFRAQYRKFGTLFGILRQEEGHFHVQHIPLRWPGSPPTQKFPEHTRLRRSPLELLKMRRGVQSIDVRYLL